MSPPTNHGAIGRTPRGTRWSQRLQGAVARLAAEPCARATVHPGSRLRPAYLFAIIPLLDMVLAQVQSQWVPRIGPLSLAQLSHGIIMLAMSVLVFARLRYFPARYRFMLIPMACLAGSIFLSLACGLLNGRMTLEDLVAAFQVIYWLVLWLGIFVCCRDRRDCVLVLKGVVVAGIYGAVSVTFLYLRAGKEGSHYTGIVASAAGLNTAKGLAGIIATAGLVALWLFRERWRLSGAFVFFMCLAAVVLTYQRAGLAATGVAVLWLALWRASARWKRTGEKLAANPVLIAAAVILVIALTVGTADLEARWDDISDPQKAGSGRITFWRVALAHYAVLDWPAQVSGIGYSRMADALERKYGARIHTHSDPLDVLLMFGAAGILSWLLLNVAILRMIAASRADPSRFAVALAIYLVMLCESLLTGQMLGPHVMAFYALAITCTCLSWRDRLRPQADAHTAAQPGLPPPNREADETWPSTTR